MTTTPQKVPETMNAEEARDAFEEGRKIMTPHGAVYRLCLDCNSVSMHFSETPEKIRVTTDQPPFELYSDGWVVID